MRYNEYIDNEPKRNIKTKGVNIMKKLVKFIRKNFKKILISTVVIAAVFIGYEILHIIATAERGYDAIGGEIFIFLMPYLIKTAKEAVKDTAAVLKKVSK